jgi:hypothetical protein
MNRSINQVYRDHILLHCLGCVDLADGQAVNLGSFYHEVLLSTKMLSIHQLMNRSIIQVYRDPIPLHCLCCVDLAEGEAVKPGSSHHHVLLFY